MKKSMNIQEIARLAGVSVATVSRVLNESPKVKDATRNNVLSVIRKFDYQPNLLGRDLRRSETMKVLILISSLEKPIVGAVVKGIEACAKEYGYQVLICPTSFEWDREQELFQMLKNRLVDGVITFGTTLSKEEISEISQKYNVVQCCEFKDTPYTCSVSIDDEKASFDAVNYLVQLGHKRIALIGDSSFLSSSSTSHREKGYRKALQKNKLNVDNDLIMYGGDNYEDGVKLTNVLVSKKNPPTAIFCLSDSIGIGCVNAIKENGYSIPEDIAVVGFDDTREAIMAMPALTTIHQPKYEIGYSSMKLLIHNMKNKQKKYEKVILNHNIIRRESTVK